MPRKKTSPNAPAVIVFLANEVHLLIRTLSVFLEETTIWRRADLLWPAGSFSREAWQC